jgi:hypothetical protein
MRSRVLIDVKLRERGLWLSHQACERRSGSAIASQAKAIRYKNSSCLRTFYLGCKPIWLQKTGHNPN